MSMPRLIFLTQLMLDASASGPAVAQSPQRPAARVSRALDCGEEAPFRKFPELLIYKGLCLYIAGKRLEAARVWERFLEIAPADADRTAVSDFIEKAYGGEGPDWLVYRGLALFEAGDYRGAERVWLKYLDIASDDAKQYTVRVLILDARERQQVHS